MPKVTAIKPRGRARDRFLVYIDEEALATANSDLLVEFSIHVDEELDETVREEFVAKARILGARDRAMRMLAAQGRSVVGLERRLTEKGETRSDAREVVRQLAELGLLDDAAFARSFVRSKVRRHGRRRIAMELAREGVSDAIANEALDEVLGDPTLDAGDTLQRLIERKMYELARLDGVTRERRILGFCQRRGFGLSETLDALRRHGREET